MAHFTRMIVNRTNVEGTNNNVDTGAKLSKVNQEELDIGDAKDASFDEGKAGQVSQADGYQH